MPRPRQVSDEQILEAARACFLEKGPQCSTEQIAERVGLSQAALFKRFGTKERLLLAALLPKEQPALIRRLEAGPDARPIKEQLIEVALEMARLFERLVPCLAMLRASDVQHAFAGEVPRPIQGTRALATFIRKAQAEGRMAGPDPYAVALALIGGLQSRAFMRHIGQEHMPKTSTEAYVRSLVEVVWNGTRPKGARR